MPFHIPPRRSRSASAAVLATGMLLSGCSPSASHAPSAQPTLAQLAATTIQVAQPTEMAVSGNDLFLLAGSQVAQLDLTTRAVTMIDVGASGDELDGLEVTEDAIWVADFDSSHVIRLARTPGAQRSLISVGAAEDVLAVGKTIWVSNHHEGSISRIDATTGAVIGTVMVGPVGSNGPQRLAQAAGSVWVDERNSSEVIRLDATTGQVVARIGVPFGPCGGILATDTAVWATGCHEATRMAHIDPATNRLVGVVAIDGYGQDPVLIDGMVWVAVGGFVGDTVLERVDPATNTVATKLIVPGMKDIGPSAVAADTLWLGDANKAVYAIPLTELAP